MGGGSGVLRCDAPSGVCGFRGQEVSRESRGWGPRIRVCLAARERERTLSEAIRT